jgi:hypothetical protein
VSDKKQEAQKRPAYSKINDESFEKIRAQELAALDEMRERTARLRHLRLKKDENERKANARKAARESLKATTKRPER